MSKLPIPEKSILVVAHPDDEVLWFASLLNKIDTVIFVYSDSPEDPELARKRATTISTLPYKSVNLALPEAGTYHAVDWQHPEPDACGLRLNTPNAVTDIKRAYSHNYQNLQTLLDPFLHAATSVFTHNPWGEYGHADHVQVYRAVDQICQRYNLPVYVSHYVSKKSSLLAQMYIEKTQPSPIRLNIDIQQTQNFMQQYQSNQCWTWSNNWQWNVDECFYAVARLNQQDNNINSVLQTLPLAWIPDQAK